MSDSATYECSCTGGRVCRGCQMVQEMVRPVDAAEKRVDPAAGQAKANDRQVGGGHYKKQGIQHWDFVAANGLDYFQGQITKYISRWKDKNGIQDLEKARHFLDKYIEVEKERIRGQVP